MELGRLLTEEVTHSDLLARFDLFSKQPVDLKLCAPEDWKPACHETTLAAPFAVSGPGTYHKGTSQELRFKPAASGGWNIKRRDLAEQLPIHVCPENVWTATRSIVLRSGCEHNYMRMTEHVIAHRFGMGLDNVTVESDTGDPPLFDVGSMPIVEKILEAGIVDVPTRKLDYYTVSEPVLLAGPHGSFLMFCPDEESSHKLTLDVAIDFPTAIGRQRIIFDVCRKHFIEGAHARTNCSRKEMLLALTVGRLFADIRNMGYTKNNILVAGRRAYYNEPAMLYNGKSLEAAWHRACLDLLAALSLFDLGRICGKVISYKAGHNLDCRLMNLLELNNCWCRI